MAKKFWSGIIDGVLRGIEKGLEGVITCADSLEKTLDDAEQSAINRNSSGKTESNEKSDDRSETEKNSETKPKTENQIPRTDAEARIEQNSTPSGCCVSARGPVFVTDDDAPKPSVKLSLNYDRSNGLSIRTVVEYDGKFDIEIGKVVTCIRYKGEDTVVIIPDGIQKIGEKAFCDKPITQVQIPSSCRTIGESAFENCAELRTVIIDSGLEYIDKCAFRNCESLTGILVPKTLKALGPAVFCDCRSLEKISLPGLEVLPINTFEGCLNIRRVEVPNLKKAEHNVFLNCTEETAWESFDLEDGIYRRNPHEIKDASLCFENEMLACNTVALLNRLCTTYQGEAFSKRYELFELGMRLSRRVAEDNPYEVFCALLTLWGELFYDELGDTSEFVSNVLLHSGGVGSFYKTHDELIRHFIMHDWHAEDAVMAGDILDSTLTFLNSPKTPDRYGKTTCRFVYPFFAAKLTRKRLSFAIRNMCRYNEEEIDIPKEEDIAVEHDEMLRSWSRIIGALDRILIYVCVNDLQFIMIPKSENGGHIFDMLFSSCPECRLEGWKDGYMMPKMRFV